MPLLRKSNKIGGWGRNRTGVRGVAVRCMATLPPSLCFGGTIAKNDSEEMERETRLELATPDLGKVVLYQLSYSRDWQAAYFSRKRG